MNKQDLKLALELLEEVLMDRISGRGCGPNPFGGVFLSDERRVQRSGFPPAKPPQRPAAAQSQTPALRKDEGQNPFLF
jgi:hypothetical protein